MSLWLASLIVRGSAWLAPRDVRARWKEEWLAEIDAARRAPNFELHTSNFTLLRSSLGAPIDALTLRRLAWNARPRFHLGQWRNDFQYSVRLLLRSPGYVATVVMGLSVGLIATITMYSAINTGLHADIAGIVDRDTLVRVRVEYPQSRSSGPSIETFPLLSQHGPGVVDVAAQGLFKASVRAGDSSISVRGAFASGSLFQVLGTQPIAGRLLEPADDRRDPNAAVVSQGFWNIQLGGRPDAIGQVILIDNRPMRIVGVVPERFRGLWSSPLVDNSTLFTTPEIWLPLSAAQTWSGTVDPYDNPLGSHLEVAARLAPGVIRRQAASEFGSAARALEAHDPAEGPVTIRVQPLILGAILDEALWLAAAYAALLGMPVALLMIGCANVTNLRLARATARTAELAVRLSMGATHRQLTRLLTIESAMLTVLALVVSALATRSLLILIGPRILTVPIQIDWRVTAFAVAVAAAATFLSGLAPGWLVTRRATAQALRQTAQAGGLGHARLRHVLVVAQIAVSMGLLTFGSLLLRSTLAVSATLPAGYDRLLVARLDFDAVGLDAGRARQFTTSLLDRLAADGRFSAAGFAQYEPFVRSAIQARRAGTTSSSFYAAVNRVTPSWFTAMGLVPIAGRLPSATERDVAVVNASTARRLGSGGESALGMSVELRNTKDVRHVLTIVGIVPDVERDLRRPALDSPSIYVPLDGSDAAALKPALCVREASNVDLSRELAQIIATMGPRAPWINVRRATDLFDQQTSDVRQMATAVTGMALVALGVAAAGLFAVMAYTVALRTREIGIRMALGARREQITGLVLRQALRLALAGAFIGLGLAQLISMMLRPALLGLSSMDPLALVPVAMLLTIITLTAGALPARRAATVDPVRALRAE